MSEDKRKQRLNKSLPLILSLIFVLVVLCSFIVNFVNLAIAPSNSFLVENRQNI